MKAMTQVGTPEQFRNGWKVASASGPGWHFVRLTPQSASQQTLLGNVRQLISNAMGMRFAKGMDLVSLAFKRRM